MSANGADKPILIAGGGIGGFAAALALSQKGRPVHILEQAAEFGEVGAGIQIGPNGVHVMRFLGVEDALARDAGMPTVYHARDGLTGRTLYKTPRNPEFAQMYGAPYYQVHRADLLETLRSTVDPEKVYLGQKAVKVEQQGDRVVIETAKGDRFEAGAVIGADGIHSAVRRTLFGEDAPRYTGIVIYRLTAPIEKLKPQFKDIGSSTFHGPHGHVTTYPISGGSQINFAGAWEIEEWQEESWSLECSKDEVHEAYKGWFQDIHDLIDATDRINKWALFDRDPLPAWTQGRCTLLGDAAHPMLPFLAQGACQAIEDGYVAAALLASSAGDWEEALNEYERVRLPRTSRVQLGARARVVSMHEPSALGRIVRNVTYWIESLTGRDAKRFKPDWIYQVNVVSDFPVRG